jgi:hypothetical protein
MNSSASIGNSEAANYKSGGLETKVPLRLDLLYSGSICGEIGLWVCIKFNYEHFYMSKAIQF